MPRETGVIRLRGARTHNLYNVNLDLPRGRLIAISGPSGSGKSSLAFDTLHAEGQRRFLLTLSGQDRALFDQLQRPDVDLVEGLPPTLSVAQHTTAPRSRSTLGTITEIHDHLRLLWSRLGTPHCPQCAAPIRKHTLAEILAQVRQMGEGRKVYLLAPLVRDQPGEHREAFLLIRQEGLLRARVDGVLNEIRDVPSLPKGKRHTIEVVVDRLVVREGMEDRFRESLATALKLGGGRVIVTHIDEGDWEDRAFSAQLECVPCDRQYPDLEPALFHFNSPAGACPRCTGLGLVRRLDLGQVIPDRALTLGQVLARLAERFPEEMESFAVDRKLLARLATLPGESTTPTQGRQASATAAWDPQGPLAQWPNQALDALLHGTTAIHPPFPGLLRGLAEDREADEDFIAALTTRVACPDCEGSGLNPLARSVLFHGQPLHRITSWSVAQAHAWVRDLKAQLLSEARPEAELRRGILDAVLPEIVSRLHFLEEVGLGYLTLDRPGPTLSGGELQRARLATYLAGGLLGVCYILDEPTIGLHPHDTERLIAALRHLQARGHTLIVVEHDDALLRQADYLVDLGPGGGRDGGRLLAAGILDEVLSNPASVTAPFLTRSTRPSPSPALPLPPSPPLPFSPSPLLPLSSSPPVPTAPALRLRGVRHHNLKNIDVAIPLAKLVCLSGVSGSGKSSLARDVLLAAARRRLGLVAPPPGEHDAIDGLELLDKVIEVDQKPLGRSSRSIPPSYVGFLDELRKVFAATRAAKARGYKPNRFSFNSKGGRCETCQGQGSLRVTLKYLPQWTIPCSSCQGKRFNAATLEVKYRDKSIADVLALTVAEALAFFGNVPGLERPLAVLAEVGLGYLTLGQPSSTLSGGEAQRVKLAAELSKAATGRTLYLLDEPTTGLHFCDVSRLIALLRRLVSAGNTVLVIEHHLEVIAAADWVIDLGPGGGEAGGEVVAQGTPREIAQAPLSITGRYLVCGTA